MTDAEKELKEFEDKAKKYFESQINFYAYLEDLQEKEGDHAAAETYRERMNYMMYALKRVGAKPVEENG